MPSLLDFTYNTRDIGGYITRDGSEILHGAFLRSDLPYKITDCDVAAVKYAGITDVIDLRSFDEAESQPCAFKSVEEINYYHCAFNGDGRVPDSPDKVAESYMEIADGHKAMADAMRIIANAEGGVLYHCTAGKDRTGVLTVFLMMLAGASDEDIIENYMQSEPNLKEIIDRLCSMYDDLNKEVITPKRCYIEDFLSLFREKYGSVENYMEEIGLAQSEINIIYNKLVKNVAE